MQNSNVECAHYIFNLDVKTSHKLERCLSCVECAGHGFGLPLLIKMECVDETPCFIRRSIEG